MGAADLFSERAFTPRSSTPKPIASFSTQPSRTLCDEESSISLPDTEITEDVIQDIFGVNFAGNAAEVV